MKFTQADVRRQEEKVRASKFPSVEAYRQATKHESLSDIAEDEIQQEIEDWLKTQSHRIWWARCRMDCPTTFTRNAIPDFMICFGGLFVAIEVKVKGKKASPEQNGELAWIRKAGGIECVATSLSEVQALIELLTFRLSKNL